MSRQTIEEIDVRGRRVLMRVDFNVPLAPDGTITDDRRIRAALPSIRSVLDRGGRLVLMSHCGRPAGNGYEPGLSLAPAARRFAEHLDGTAVGFPSQDCTDDAAAEAVAGLGDGEVILLENLRFHAGEKKGDPELAARLASYGDIYCSDAFGTAHRSDASMVAVPEAMADRPRVAGLLLERELKYLSEVIEEAARPFVAVLGGAKVSDKLGAIRNLRTRVDTILIGGAMAYTFLAAREVGTGESLVEEPMLEQAREILADSGPGRAELVLPSDHACGRELAPGTEVREMTGSIEAGWMGLDIGPATRDRYRSTLVDARTIVWNGPMGVFEMPPFDAGTRAVAEATGTATERGAISVVGGGDSAAAVEAFGLDGCFSHVSTGGGASLSMLEGRSLPSLELLDPVGV